MQKEDLDLRYIQEGDTLMANEWLKGWKHKGTPLNPLPIAMYPSTGLVLFNKEDETPIYIGFVWMSNSKMAQIGFVTRNPFYKKKIPLGIRKSFLESLVRYCKDLGYDYVITWAENKFLIEDFKAMGMVETSNQCSELLGKIKDN